MRAGLVERYDERIAGVVCCYDRIVITGTIPRICHARGMTSFLYGNGIRIFDYPKFAATLRDNVRENAAKLAEAAGVSIEHISKSLPSQGGHCRQGDCPAGRSSGPRPCHLRHGSVRRLRALAR